MADIRLQTITVDQEPLIIQNGKIFLNNNTTSLSSNAGSLVVHGGVGILGSSEGMTIAGGLGLGKSLRLGDSLNLYSSGNFYVSDRLAITQDTINISCGNGNIDVDNNRMTINHNMDVIGGGASVLLDMTVGGGVAIGKKLITGSVNISRGSGTMSRLGALGLGTGGNIVIGQMSSETEVPLSISNVTSGNKANLFFRPGRLYYDYNSSWVTRIAPASTWFSVCWSPERSLYCAVAFTNSANSIMTSPDGINWTSRNVQGRLWRSITWSPELGLFCAVGRSGSNRIATSPDGINWNYVQVPEITWETVCWSPQRNLFCSVSAFDNRVLLSSNGTTWSMGNTPSGSWRSIVWSPELGLFCAVGTSGINRVITSPDGVTWTAPGLASEIRTTNWWGLAWSPQLGLFCAVAENGTRRIMTSPDGRNWTLQRAPADFWWKSVCWAGEIGLFVAISRLGIGTGDRIMTSPDGVNWTLHPSLFNKVWNSVTWSPQLSRFCAVSESDTVITSDAFVNLSRGTGLEIGQDGNLDYMTVGDEGTHDFYAGNNKVWDLKYGKSVSIGRTSPSGETLNTLDVEGGIHLRMGVNTVTSNAIVKRVRGNVGGADTLSPNDIIWHNYQTDVPFSTVGNVNTIEGNSITWSPELGIFCAAFSHQSSPLAKAYMARSRDGIRWEYNEVSDNRWFSIEWSPELRLFCAVGNNNGNVGTSRDGLNWTIQSNALDNAPPYRAVKWSPELRLFCVLNVNKIYTSPNGIDWQSTSITNDKSWWSLCWSSELALFCAVGASGTIARSKDGFVWTISQLTDTRDIRDVIWCPALGKFYGIYRTGTNTVIESKDGVTWTSRTISNNTNVLISIVWNNELSLLTVSGDGVFYASRDGRRWTNILSRSLRNHIWSPQTSTYVSLRQNSTGVVVSRPILPAIRSALMANPSQFTVDQERGDVFVGIPLGEEVDNAKLTVGGSSGILSGNNVTVGNAYADNTMMSNRLRFGALETKEGGNGDACLATLEVNDIYSSDLNMVSMNSSDVVVGHSVSSGNISCGTLFVTNTITTSQRVDTNNVTFTGTTHTLGNIVIDDDTLFINDSQNDIEYPYNLILNGDIKISGNTKIGVDGINPSILNGSVSIRCSENASGVSVGGALTVAGGVAIGQNMFVDDIVNVGELETYGAVYVGETTGTTFIVSGGGMSIGGNLFVDGEIATHRFVTPRLTTGSLSIAGGFVITSTSNNSLIMSGGGSVARDMYIGDEHVSMSGVTLYSSGGGTSLAFGDTISERFSLKREINANHISFKNSSNNTIWEVLNSGQYNIGTDAEILGRTLMSNGISVLGGGYIGQEAVAKGDVIIRSTTQSLNKDQGALQVQGGVHAGGNVNVRGSLDLAGDLFVGGDVTYLNTRTITLRDNIWYIHSNGEGAPEGGYLGFFAHRFQKDNDRSTSGSLSYNPGDIEQDKRYIEFVLQNQDNLDTVILNQLRLPSSASPIDDFYKGWWIRIASGLSALQVRRIMSYNGTTKIATMSSEWNISTPGQGETVHLFDKSHVGVIFDENNSRFEFASGVPNTDDYLDIRKTGLVDVGVYSMEIISQQNSINGSTGALILTGGLSSNNTTEATSSTSGGTLTNMGGWGVEQSLYVGEKVVTGDVEKVEIHPYSSDVYGCEAFTVVDLQHDGGEGEIIGTTFDEDTFSFDIYMSVRGYSGTNATGNIVGSAHYHIRGIIGLDQIVTTYVGDQLGIDFELDVEETTSLKYIRTGSSIVGAASLGFRWKAFTIGV